MSDYQDRQNFEIRRTAPDTCGGLQVPEGKDVCEYFAEYMRSALHLDWRVRIEKAWDNLPKPATTADIDAWMKPKIEQSISGNLDEQQWREETARLFNNALVSLRSNAGRNPKIGDQIRRAAQNIEIVLSVLSIKVGGE